MYAQTFSDQILSTSLQAFQPLPSFLLPLNREMGKTTLESTIHVNAEGIETHMLAGNLAREVVEQDVGYATRQVKQF